MRKERHAEGTERRVSVLFFVILFCFFLSGVAGLIYEVLWVRMIDKVIGSAPFAVAIVLAIFMGGLALGSYLAGRFIDRINFRGDLLFLYGAAEVVIGLYSLLLPLFIALVKPIYVHAYNSLFQYFWAYQIFTFLGCSLLLILPTTLMGITLPVLCRFYVANLDHLGARTGRLYGINTVGAGLGALLCGFFLINRIGVWGTLFVAAAINFLVGFLCIVLGRRQLSHTVQALEKDTGHGATLAEGELEVPSVKRSRHSMATWALIIFAVSGFCSMAYEVIWTRLLGLIIGPTTYSFTLVIAAFIIGLAAGSLLFGWLGDRTKGVFTLLAATQLVAACLALSISQFFGNSQFFFAKLITAFQHRFHEMMLVQFAVVFCFLLGPTILLGATFPLVNRIYARSLPVIGKSIGTAYALNTIGAILGALAAGFILIPFLGKEGGLRFLMAIQFSLTLIALVTLRLRVKGRFGQWLGLSGIALLGLTLFFNFPSWDRKLLSHGWYRNLEEAESYLASTSWLDALYRGSKLLARYESQPKIVFYGDGIGGFTTVEKLTDSLGNINYVLINSGKPDASSHGDRSTQTLLAHVPLLFHPHPKTVMVLGLASGMTAGEVLHYPVRQLDVLEISDQVVRACEIFTPWNNNCLTDPRTRIIVQDGRNHLALSREKYDVIISEPSNPWMAGLANLYTLECFGEARKRLSEHGIFVQWIHSYEMDWPTFSLVGRTFAEVFPQSLLMTTMPWESSDYLLVGFVGHKGFNLEVAKNNMRYLKGSKNISLADPVLLFHLIITEDLKKFFGPGTLHTDTWPRLEFAAPKQLYRGDLSIGEDMNNKPWLLPHTKAIIEASNSLDTVLGLVEFSAMAYADDPPFGIIDLDDTTPAQKEQYLSILKRYCEQNFVPDYTMFPDNEVRKECATIQAIKIKQHVALNPKDAQAYSGLSVAALELRKLEEAFQALKATVSLNPHDFRAHSNLGIIRALQGKYEDAITHYSEAVRIRPDFTEAYSNLGIALTNLGRYEEAVAQFREALRITPDDAEIHHDLGVALALQGKLEEAVVHYSEALRINPADPRIHYNYGVALTNLGRYEEAVAHYAEVLKIDPDFTEARDTLTLILQKMKKSRGTSNK